MTDKKMKIEFAPGCFDHFEGTQEELDALMAEIQEMFDSGEALKNAIPLTDLDEEEIDELISGIPDNTEVPRTLH